MIRSRVSHCVQTKRSHRHTQELLGKILWDLESKAMVICPLIPQDVALPEGQLIQRRPDCCDIL